MSDNGVDHHPLARHPANPAPDVICLSLRFKDDPSLISIHIGATDIGHHFEPLTKVVNVGDP
jgi:hypothetical protein